MGILPMTVKDYGAHIGMNTGRVADYITAARCIDSIAVGING
jgi:hypothetical protein